MAQIPPHENDDLTPTMKDLGSDEGTQTNPENVAVSIDTGNYQNHLINNKKTKSSL